MTKNTFVVAVLAVFASTIPAQAQSPLADAARREAERRKAVKAVSIHTYTNEDLTRLPARATPTPPTLPPTPVTTIGPAGSAAPPAAAAAAPGQPAPPPAAATAATEPRDEKYWRSRITTARANLSRAELFAESLQSRINALSTDFVNRDDPAQRQQIFEQRQRALEELDRVKTEIAAFMQQIADIEEEARRLNVPPGWLR